MDALAPLFEHIRESTFLCFFPSLGFAATINVHSKDLMSSVGHGGFEHQLFGARKSGVKSGHSRAWGEFLYYL